MFWRFNYMPSQVDSLLDKDNITLEELMDEEDIVQECKSQNKKLIDFLVKPESLQSLVSMIVDEPADDTDERTRYKYPNIACELITSDVNQITDALSTSEALMNAIYAFLDSDGTLNPLQASFFSKLMGLLITRRSDMMVAFLKAHETFVDRLLHHIGVSAIMDVLLRLITCIESVECRNSCLSWLSEQRLVSRLVGLIDPSETSEKHTNAAQSLCDIIRLSRDRDQMSQSQEFSGNETLLKAIESRETLSEILDHVLNGERLESVIVNGLSIIQTLLESRKISLDGLPEPVSLMNSDQMTPGVINAIEAVIPRLKDFHDILLHPPKQHYIPMPSTVGTLLVPLGQTRLQIIRLIAMLIMTNDERIFFELYSLGTVSVLLDLFFEYTWNNFLHASVEHCITGILNSSLPNNLLRNQLFSDFRLLERITEAFKDGSALRSEPTYARRGHMGHVTRIANQLVSYSTADCSVLNNISDEERERWNHCVSSYLADINRINTSELVGGSVGLASSSDDDDEFRSISFPQDDAMQKAFSEYQQQKMTTDFVEQFGYNEDEFAEQEECIGSPFTERISGINFELSTVEDSPTAAAMFEHACSDRIRQFDSADSDEELWEDKASSFSNQPDHRQSAAIQRVVNTTVANMANRGGDSEDDDYEAERSAGDSDASNDSDLELASPRYVQQTESQVSEVNNTVNVVISQSASSDESSLLHHDIAKNATEGSEDDIVMSCAAKISNENESLEVHAVEISFKGSLSHREDHLSSVDMLDIETLQADSASVAKMDSMRLPCHLDVYSPVAGPDTISLSSLHNGPV